MKNLPRPIYTQQIPAGPVFDLIFVEGGGFEMGGTRHDDEQPVHWCEVPSLYLGKYPVTQVLWEAVMSNHPSRFVGPDRPVEQVSYYDAAAFCNALNERCGYEPCYFSDEVFRILYGKADGRYTLPNDGPVYQKTGLHGYRLPTEAEWEYAARGGEEPGKRPRYEYAGGDKLDELGWYSDNSHRETKPVGLKLPNELGLYDMSGNVWEWCEDQWHKNYEGAPVDGSAWVDREQGSSRVLRGGSWYSLAVICRSAYRNHWLPTLRDYDQGFRLVLSFPPV